jgi:hypothetical protein
MSTAIMRDVNPDEYIESLAEPRQSDVREIDDLIQRVAPQLARSFDHGMITYGSYHYRYATGREGGWFPIALAGQKRYTSLYVMAENERGYLAENYRDRLPRADIGRSCVRFSSLADVDLEQIAALVREGAGYKPS